jgi:glycosyltransferase involved in cell wall biosynthesis
MQGKHVLQILPALATGGAERMVVHLSGELTRAGVKTGVVSFFDNQGSQLEHALRADGLPVWSLGKHLGPDLGMIGRLRRLFRTLQPDVIHTHLSALRYAMAGVIGLERPPRIVHTIHRVAERDSEFGLRWLHRWCLRRGVTLIAVSEEVANSCARVYQQKNVPVIPNGIPVNRQVYRPETREKIRRAWGLDDDSFVFCCVARLSAVKNHKDLIEAFSGMVDIPGVQLVLAGGGELRMELEELSRVLRIQEQVHFLGERDDIADVLAASDAFVLSSISEGNPMSVLEAMSAGLPVVATSVGGMPELVRSGTDGWLVPPGDTRALRDAMRRLVLNRDSRQVMSDAVRQRAMLCFDSGAMGRSYLNVYERLGS